MRKEWRHLRSKCLSYTEKRDVPGASSTTFSYKVCPFDKATQNGINLGTFIEWSPPPPGSIEALMRDGREPHPYSMLLAALYGNSSTGPPEATAHAALPHLARRPYAAACARAVVIAARDRRATR